METVLINKVAYRLVTNVTNMRYSSVVIEQGYLNLIYIQDYLLHVYEYEEVVLRVKL